MQNECMVLSEGLSILETYFFETNRPNEKFSVRRVKCKKISRHPGGNML